MSLPALAGVLSAAGAVSSVGGSGLNLIGGAAGGALSGAVPLDKALSKINSALAPVTQAFDKTATQAAVLYGTFFKLKSGFDTAVGIVSKVGSVVTGAAGLVFSAVKKVVTTAVSGAAATVGAVLSGDVIAKPIRALAAGLDVLNAPALNLIGSLGTLRDSMTAVGTALTPFVRMANPAIAQRFQFASDDLTASFGKALLPAMRAATTVTRAFADVTFALAGPVQRFGKAFDPLVAVIPKIVGAVSPLISGLGAVGDALTETIKPVIAIIGDQLGNAFDLLGAHLRGLMAVLEPSIKLIANLQRLNGLGLRALQGGGFDAARAKGLIGAPGFSGASVGAAVRNVGFSSVEGFQNKAIQQAFSLGTATSPEEKTANATEQILLFLQSFKIPGLDEIVQKLSSAISSAVPSKEEVKQKFDNIGRDAGRWLEEKTNRARRSIDELF